MDRSPGCSCSSCATKQLPGDMAFTIHRLFPFADLKRLICCPKQNRVADVRQWQSVTVCYWLDCLGLNATTSNGEFTAVYLACLQKLERRLVRVHSWRPFVTETRMEVQSLRPLPPAVRSAGFVDKTTLEQQDKNRAMLAFLESHYTKWSAKDAGRDELAQDLYDLKGWINRIKGV